MDRQPGRDKDFWTEVERKDALAMQVLAPLSSTYLPWTLSAMRPSGVVAILNDIVVNRRRRVVEIGGGISTFYISRLLRQRGGHLWTVEHDEEWAGLLGRELAGEGLGDVATVVHAPLVPVAPQWPGDDSAWYERESLKKGVGDEPIDLLVVDGPPAYKNQWRHRRYPAVPFFAPLLAADYTVVLDDIDRRGEQEVLARWEGELGITFERRLTNGRIGIGHSGASFDI